MSPLMSPTSPFPTSPGRSLVTFPSQTIGPAVGTTDPATVSVLAAGGIPATALDAYRRAAAAANPACGITWPLLAAIGRVESNHGRFAGATLHSDGTSTPPIIGIRLDGSRSVVVRDTDGGRLDGDPTFDHAVGPMQFIPSTWAKWAQDGNGDGVKDVDNIYDATLGAAMYLCATTTQLETDLGLAAAYFSYNHSTDYVAEALAYAKAYESADAAGLVPKMGLVPLWALAPRTAASPGGTGATASTTSTTAPGGVTPTAGH